MSHRPIAWAVGLTLAVLTLRGEDPLPQIERLQTSPVLRHLVPNPVPPPRTPPEQTLSQMYLPAGFRAEVVVAEPDLHQPVAFAFDERGRIWVAEAYSYPQRQPKGQGRDKLVIFEDADADGKFESRKVFAEGLNLVSGFEVGYGGVWVGAAPQLLFIPDRNHDDHPDGPPQVLLDGFGYQDTHECLNSFMWGPDGWLYGNQGVFNYAQIGPPGTPTPRRVELRAGVWRYHPIRHRFEVFAEGGSNQWGLDYDEQGQIFMTHCRSYWGRGGTTHVIQGGHFWNQANANYPAFIVANPPSEFPGFRNYLLASARYDHGAGGAGEPGSDAIYGGHSHVGTMIYFGDNWPDQYRGRLFTHNLHGHQINQQVNRRLGSGFDTVHAGRDLSFCADPKFVAVDLQYGPDGAVYLIDWYDQQHCHNPNTERWDRSNGRLYRIQHAASFRPAKVNLGQMNDEELLAAQAHKNEWFGRTARRILHERAANGTLTSGVIPAAGQLLSAHPSADLRLRALWLTHLLGQFGDEAAQRSFADSHEYIRAWAVQLSAEDGEVSAAIHGQLVRLAVSDPSPVVRLYLASAVARLPEKTAWAILDALAEHGEDREDRNLPCLIWHSLAPRMGAPDGQIDRALALADRTLLPQLADWIYWHAASLGDRALERVLAKIQNSHPADQPRFLAGLELALSTRAQVAMPANWPPLATQLYSSQEPGLVRRAELIAAAFGDRSRLPRLRQILRYPAAAAAQREHAFTVLSRARDQESLPVFLELLQDNRFRPRALALLGRFDSAEIPKALLQSYAKFNAEERNAALLTLTGRASYAAALLDAIAQGTLQRDQLTALHVRQMSQLGDPKINQRIAESWGRFSPSPAEKEARIAQLEKVFNEAPLWAYDGRAGREHFLKLCASCHRLGEDGTRLGPELTGAGRHGIRYYLENIIDPNAVVGTDFQLTTVETRDGEVISGLLVKESAETLTIRTTVAEQTVAKSALASRSTSDHSLMPEGLLEGLPSREQIELLKFLANN